MTSRRPWLASTLGLLLCAATSWADAPQPAALWREVTLHDEAGGWRLHGTWSLWSAEPTLARLELLPPDAVALSILLDGSPAPLASETASPTLEANLSGAHTLVVQAWIPGPHTARLPLLPATGGRVTLPDAFALTEGGTTPRPERVGGSWYTGGPLDIAPAHAISPPPARPTGQLATRVTVEDGRATIDLRVQVQPLRGAVRELTLRWPDAPDDLEHTSAARAVLRTADTLTVTLAHPTERTATVSFRGSVSLDRAHSQVLPLPQPELVGAHTTASYMTVFSDAEIATVIPALVGGAGVPADGLPDWARFDGPGTLLTQREGKVHGSVRVLSSRPPARPTHQISSAQVEVKLDRSGRWVGQASFTVHNDHAPGLDLDMPPGLIVIEARVDGKPTPVAQTPTGLRVPLPRSLDTPLGSLSQDVHLHLLQTAPNPRWHRRSTHIALPVVGADIADLRVRVHLPEGFLTDAHCVDVAELVEDAHAREALTWRVPPLQEAMTALRELELLAAAEALNGLDKTAADHPNVARLWSMIAALHAPAEADTPRTARIRAQLAADQFDLEVAERDAILRARRATRIGDAAAAAQAWQQVVAWSPRTTHLGPGRRDLDPDLEQLARFAGGTDDDALIPSSSAPAERTEFAMSTSENTYLVDGAIIAPPQDAGGTFAGSLHDDSIHSLYAGKGALEAPIRLPTGRSYQSALQRQPMLRTPEAPFLDRAWAATTAFRASYRAGDFPQQDDRCDLWYPRVVPICSPSRVLDYDLRLAPAGARPELPLYAWRTRL